MTIHIYTTDQVMFIYSTLYNTDSQLHSTKEEITESMMQTSSNMRQILILL